MGVARAADQERVMPVEGERGAGVRAGNHGERDAHRKARARAAWMDMALPCLLLPIRAAPATDRLLAMPGDQPGNGLGGSHAPDAVGRGRVLGGLVDGAVFDDLERQLTV